MIYAQPGEEFTAVLDAAGDTGLVGIVTLQIENVDGTTHTAPTTADIVEVETGIYSGVRTAPDEAETFIVVWNNAGARAAEELVVVTELPYPGSVGIEGLSFLDMQNEVKARGFDEVGDERIKQWINRAYSRLCDRHPWPFLEKTTAGESPLEIEDFRAALTVTDRDNLTTLEWTDGRDFRTDNPDYLVADQGGPPSTWFFQSGLNLVHVDTGPGVRLAVFYTRIPPDLVADEDNALVPPRYRMLIVDMAVCEAYKDSDNLEAWQILRNDVEEQIVEMEIAILIPNLDGAQSVLAGFDSSTDW